MNSTNELENVRTGDRVILVIMPRRNRSTIGSPPPLKRAVVVDSATAKGIRVDDTWYDKTGRAVRGHGRYSGYSINAPAPGELEELDREAAQQAEQIREINRQRAEHEATETHQIAARLSSVEHETWERLSVEQLRQIAEWMDAP